MTGEVSTKSFLVALVLAGAVIAGTLALVSLGVMLILGALGVALGYWQTVGMVVVAWLVYMFLRTVIRWLIK